MINMFSYTGYYSSWFIFVLPAILFATYAQMKISSSYKKYSKIPSKSGLTGAQVARYILDKNGLNEVRIEQVRGVLTDHYDPRARVLRLSPEVYSGSSIASVSVASHEVGHAIQHQDGYFPLILRNTIAPIAMFGSNLVWIFIILGFIFSPFFINLGIALFIAAVLFQIVTLPVEFNASRRALQQLENGIISRDQIDQAESMLKAAALTYVAATLVAISELLRLLAITNRRR
ncbi:zinc metallopeptidase [Soehngenia longivitae]|uniref:Zinc metallopeptidase n=2 Tax=Soehngenia longivitae TaxID=2562294 RepID=A0A4Z0D4Z0_9FIRM|nr:zinc metallopeptidase [Soehngenia longivitae]